MDIFANAKRQFIERLSGGTKSISVPEWGEGGEDAVIFYRPMTLAQEGAIMAAVQNGSITDGYIETLMVRSLKDDAKTLMFPQALKSQIKRGFDPSIVKRIVNEMGGIDELMLPEDDSEKKS